MHLNPYSIGPSISGILILLLGIFVLCKSPKNPTHQSFFFSLFCVFVWLSFYGVIYNFDNNTPFINNYYKFAYCAINFIPVAFFSQIIIWLDLKKLFFWNLINHIYGAVVCIAIYKTDLIISGTYQYFFGSYPKAGPLHIYFLLYFGALLLVGVFFLFSQLRIEHDHHKRTQIKYFLIGYSIILFACFDFIPNYGIELYPLGFVFCFVFAFILSYAIIKHRLLEIKTIISTGIVYSILIALVFLFYSLTVLILERYLQNYLGYSSLSLSIACAFIIGLAVVPLKNIIQNLIDTSLLKGTPIQISEENILLRQELNNANKLSTVAILASELAHEIKNPITTINTFAEYLPAKQGDLEFLNKCRQTLLHESSRIQNLLGKLLSYAKPTPPNLESVDPQEILDEILILIEHKCLKQNIEIRRIYTAKQSVLADSNQLKQALLNIIINAIESMPQAGTLTIETSADRRSYFIFIKDTGFGIKPEDLPKIFNHFSSNKINGTGLGLSITQRIIEEHGGKISVESIVGSGTTFKIKLPIKSENSNE